MRERADLSFSLFVAAAFCYTLGAACMGPQLPSGGDRGVLEQVSETHRRRART